MQLYGIQNEMRYLWTKLGNSGHSGPRSKSAAYSAEHPTAKESLHSVRTTFLLRFFLTYLRTHLDFERSCDLKSRPVCSLFLIYRGTMQSLKVSKFHKQIFLFSFDPKNERNYFLISVLASKNGSKP